MTIKYSMIDIVILNRNLRLADNPAIYYGSLRSNYLVIYLYDESYWNGNGKSKRQLKFSNDCLAELNQSLKKLMIRWLIRINFQRIIEYQMNVERELN